jgi:hypothetical protein
MFAPGTPDRPWVPACEKCNHGASEHDQFMQRLAMMWGAERTKDGVAVGEKILRAMDYKEQRKFNRNLIRNLSVVNIWSPGGLIWLGQTFKLKIDGERLAKVLDKVVRGWFWKVTNRSVPPGYSVTTHPVGAGPTSQQFRENERHMLDFKPIVVGDGAFSIRWAFSPQDENISAWRMEFYRTVAYMGYTTKEEGGHQTFLKISDPDPPAAP